MRTAAAVLGVTGVALVVYIVTLVGDAFASVAGAL